MTFSAVPHARPRTGDALSHELFRVPDVIMRPLVLAACAIAIFSGQAPYSVYLFLATNLLFVAICGLLLARHRGVPHPESDFSSRTMQVFLIIGAIAAGLF